MSDRKAFRALQEQLRKGEPDTRTRINRAIAHPLAGRLAVPRIRSIKPEFWTSGQVLECSTNARLLFIGLWNFCDDAGRHPDRPKQIKAEIFPADPFTEDDVRGMLDELSTNGLVRRYVIENQEYLQVTGWHHQRIDKPQSPKYPGPIEESSGNDPGTLPPDRIGKDRIGKDRRETTTAPRPNGDAPPTDDPPAFICLPLNDKSEHAVFDADIERWQGLYPAVDVRQQLRNMRGWLDSNPGKRKTRRGVERFITNWLSREQDRGGTSPPKRRYEFNSPAGTAGKIGRAMAALNGGKS